MSRRSVKVGMTKNYFLTGMEAIVRRASKAFLLALCIAILLPGMARAADQPITTIAGGWIGDNGPATMAGLAMPQAVTVDSFGNIYVADMGNNRIRKVYPSGVITTVAGNGISGYSGDGGPATSANLSRPSSVAVDASGALYISDAANNRIRKVDASGVITTVAGNGTAGYSGDNGPAIDASISIAGRPQGGGIARDASGNIYIADTNNNRIRKVDTSGMITTMAGNGIRMYSGDNGPAIAASLNAPSGVLADSSGNIFIADRGNQRVRKVDASGMITTTAGNGSTLYSGDGGPATAAGISSPQAVSADASGNIYIADSNERIRKVDASGIITTVAGNGTAGYSGDGGPAIMASMRTPQGLFVDASGNLYICDGINNRIRKVDTSAVINTVAGGWLGDGGPAVAATFASPRAVALDASGNVYIADSNNQRIRKMDASGVITTIAGNGTTGYSGDNGPAVSAGLNSPWGIAADTAGNIYIADTTNHRVRKIDASGVITTVAGNGTTVFSGDNGPAVAAGLSAPQAVAVDAFGNIYIADAGHYRIRKVDASGAITTVAGNGSTMYSGDGGPATSAGLFVPRSVVIDASGIMFIADTGHHRVRMVDASGIINTIAGNGIAGYAGDDGPATSAMLNNPSGIVVDGSGNIYISDNGNSRIRKVDASGMITTVAGSGVDGYSGDGGPATSAMLSNPYGIAVNGSGAIYIADASNCRVRLVGNGQTVSLREMVVDSSGNPISGAYIMVVGNPSLSAYSDGSGTFILPVPQGVPFSHSISKTGYRTLYTSSRTLTTSSLTYRQRILYTDSEVVAWGVAPGFSAIRGRALDLATSQTISNPAVNAASTLYPGVTYAVVYDSSCGAGTGTCYYSVINVTPYDPVVLTVSAPGYITAQSTFNPLPPDAVGSLVIRLQQSGSADLSAWYRRDVQAQGNGLNAVTYGNDRYVAVGEAGEVFTSADGITWAQTGSGTNNSLFGVAYGNNIFVAVGYTGTILTSSTGTNWTQVAAGTADSIRAITFGNNMFVAVGADGAILTSTSGVDWTRRNSGTTNDLTGIAYGSAMFVAVGDAGTVLTSSDASVWTPASPGPDNNFLGITCGNNIFAAVVSGSIFTSSDGGSTWTQISQTIPDQFGSPHPFGALRRIGYGNNIFVALSVNTSRYVSSDGINWEEVRVGGYSALRAVTYGGNGFAAVGQGDVIVTSPDARVWTLRQTYANNILFGAGYGNNGFVAVGQSGGLFSSPDGVVWTQTYSGTANQLNGVAYGNNAYVAVGNGGAVLISPNGLSWTLVPVVSTNLSGITYGNNRFIAVGSSDTILTSPDGTVWSLATSGATTNYFHSVTYGNNRYVAVGAGGVIVISYDGVTWTPVTSGVTTGTLLSVAYGNGMFIAVGPGEVPIIASSDGITWNTVNPGGDPTSMYTIVFVNNEFVAGGSNGSIVTSQDGITWSPKLENMSMNSVRGIVYGNNSLVAVGEGHMILQSGSLAVPTYVITASAVPGGSISPSSSVSIPSGGSQTFTITPNGGYHIADVLVDGLSFGAITNYTFSNVTANHTIFASFAQDPTQPLIVQISGNGSGFVDYSTGNVCQSASCTQAFAEGSSIILTAVATSGSTFAGWSGSCTGTEPCTVLMDAARTVTATFNTVPSSPDVITTVAGGWVGDGGPATMAGLASPWSVTKDASGNVYIADMRHHRIRKVDISGVITTVAGNGESGYSGDGGPALLANLNGPSGLTVDAAGNIYISDTSNHRIRKVDASGMITTVAGNGTLGYSGDGGPAVVASLNSPRGLSVDPSGNIYIADANNRRVRKVDASGTITTVAGSGAYGYSGDGGPATAASFNSTWDVAVDPAGNMYIADMGNHRVRKVDTSGIITTVAGNGIAGYSGDGGPATLASLSSPRSIAIALGGSLYIADSGNQVIRKMDPAGMIMTVAGNGTSGYSGDGGPALAASLGSAFDVAVDNAANIYIADAMNQRIRKVDASGIIDTFAGGWLGDGGPAIAATVNRPQGVALDRFGNLLIADPGHDRVRKVGASGIITTLAGDGIAGYSGDNGPANQANLNSPTSVTADAAGNVFIADTANHRVRKVDPSGVITTVAGDGTPGYYGDNGPAVSASLNSPYGVSVDSGGNVYIADMNNHRIRKIDASGVISTVAGNGLPGYSGDNGAAVSASLNAPRGVAADASGNLYIADSNNQRVRKVDPSGVITTVAGSGFRGYYGDGGPALSALLSNPASVAIDPSGAIFIADVGNQRIRKVDTSGVITTIAGNGIAGYSGDGGPATFASLSMNRAMDTGGIAVDAIGNLYIADTSNSRIRLVGSEVPTVTLTETVFNSSGIPIEGALAQVAGGSSFSALSDIYGRFVLPVPQGVTFSHIISKTGYRTWYSTSRILTVSSNGPSRTLYTDEEVAAWGVQPGYSAIRGRARDYTTGLFLNNPAASAVSTLNPAVSYPVIYDAACGTGTGTCYYTVINVAPYDPVVLTVSAPGYTTVQTTLNPLPPDAIGSAMIMLNKVPKYRVTTNSPAIAAGNEHTVALKSDGTVVAWGENDSGACTVPADLSNVTAISSGAWHTVALKSDGTVVGWGQNNSGECSPPAGLSNVIAIAAGDLFTLAAKSDGTVVSWGAGDNTVPAGLTGVTAVAAGVMHKVALKSDGTVAAWGFCNPDYGQCAAPAGLTGVTAIAAGPWHSVALKSDGTVVAWGSNLYGESSVPSDLSGVVSIAAGAMHTAALKSDGTVVTWGSYYSGTGTAPAGVSDVVAIAAGYGHTVALKSDGTLVAWGYNGYGESTVPEGLNLGAGRISCDPTTVDYNSGSVCIITPGTGHHVADVKVGSTGTPLSSVGPVTSYTIGNITADMSIAASFEMNTYTITAGAGSNGSIVPSGTLTVSHGGNGAFTITPEAGYHVADVLVDGASIGAVESYTFANVTADHTISAAFAINTYTITAAAGAGGSVVCTPATVDYGLNSMCTITANTGFHITDVLVDGVSAGAIASHPFVNVTADHTISANFAINTYTITATAGTGGAVVCTPSTVDYGLNSTCTITANTGFHITDVLVDGEPAGAITSRTFTNVTADHTISASFAINTYTITATAGPGGAIACTPSIVNYGASSACTITPDTGYHIFEVLVDGVPAGAVGTHSFTDVTADHTISVSFMINRYTIGVSKSGTGTGTITSAPAGISCGADCSEVYDFGTSVSLTATPSADSVFTGWSGACSGTGSCTLMAGSDQTVSSTFSRAITLTSPNGGDNWSRGVTYAISWTYAGDPGASVRIELLKGGVLQLAITSSTPIGSNGTGSYSWSIPKNEWGGADYTIRITSTANSSFTDVSDGPFSISK